MSVKRNSVRVTILNEDYNIRSDASVEHTRDVAQYVDRAIRQVMASGMVVETNKAAILAALQIAGELFEARENTDELSRSIRTLSEETRSLLSAEPAREYVSSRSTRPALRPSLPFARARRTFAAVATS